jgi:hypothetical protein
MRETYEKWGAKIFPSKGFWGKVKSIRAAKFCSTPLMDSIQDSGIDKELQFNNLQRNLAIVAVNIADKEGGGRLRKREGGGRLRSRSLSHMSYTNSLPRGLREAWRPAVFYKLDDCATDMSVADAMVASCAAPTVFPTYKGFTDGSFCANNPSMIALTLALENGLESGVIKDLSKVRVLSLGTGFYPGGMRCKFADPNVGLAQWVDHLVKICLDMTSIMPQIYSSTLLGSNLYRVDPELPAEFDMFDASPRMMEQMIATAEAVDLEPAAAWLRAYWMEDEVPGVGLIDRSSAHSPGAPREASLSL